MECPLGAEPAHAEVLFSLPTLSSTGVAPDSLVSSSVNSFIYSVSKDWVPPLRRAHTKHQAPRNDSNSTPAFNPAFVSTCEPTPDTPGLTKDIAEKPRRWLAVSSLLCLLQDLPPCWEGPLPDSQLSPPPNPQPLTRTSLRARPDTSYQWRSVKWAGSTGGNLRPNGPTHRIPVAREGLRWG